MSQELINQDCSVPYSIIDATQQLLNKEKMQIDGELPDDLQGHVFIVAPVGTVESKGLPSQDGNTYLNGDGMIYRLDFDQEGEVTVKTQIVKPEDYKIDKQTVNKNWLKFRNHGIIRFSLILGFRNELNTAFLPMKFGRESNERLLITYDAGLPYEINPATLEVMTPVGKKSEWQAVTKLPYVFPPILSTAHPVFDTYTCQMFTVNYGRSLGNLLGEKKQTYIAFLKESKTLQPYVKLLQSLIDDISDIFTNGDFVHLLCWNGAGHLQRWKLINPDRTPISVKQSLHQIGITEDYIVLMDTSFTTGISQLINNPWPEDPVLAKNIRELLESPPSPDSVFYIVNRKDLTIGQDSVVVKKVVIRGEACHFLVDYKNPDQKITLHISHICAWQVSDWVRSYDESPYEGHKIPQQLHGMQQCETDISQMGRYVIDVSEQEPKIESQKIIFDDTCTWGAGLFAYLDRLPSSGMTPEKLDNIYWVSLGLWKDLMTKFMCQLYETYPYRQRSLEEVIELAKNGDRPSCLYRLHTSSNEEMAIVDHFALPKGHIALSPQFVPRNSGEESSINGYIVCTISTPKRNEVWIFDAADLKQGPLCKLHHPRLNFGFSLHTTWLKNINFRREAIYKVEVTDERDYQSSMANMLDFMDQNLSSLTSDEKEAIAREMEEISTPH